jgi:hypothetical protein
MKFEAQIYNSSHYHLLVKWFSARRFPRPDSRYLPPNGLVISCNGVPLVAGFLFCSDAKIAAIAHLVADPDSAQEPRRKALEILIGLLTNRAQDLGMGQVGCSTNLKSLGCRFENMGFQKLDENISTYRRNLCHSGV